MLERWTSLALALAQIQPMGSEGVDRKMGMNEMGALIANTSICGCLLVHAVILINKAPGKVDVFFPTFREVNEEGNFNNVHYNHPEFMRYLQE